jgi:branched-subunit amino acid aminotransferase/4-amino-4-deoxychorismate lyase
MGAPHGMKLLASQNGVRAWPGGFGYAKVGANYGPSLMANGEARARGYDQVLWLLNGQITEAGASNFFVMWKSKEGKTQLVTAPLGDKIILDGVTRRSILQLARERLSDERTGLDKVEIVERQFTMDDIVEAVHEDRIIEAFAAGTAVSLIIKMTRTVLTVNSTLYARSPSFTIKTKISKSQCPEVTVGIMLHCSGAGWSISCMEKSSMSGV